MASHITGSAAFINDERTAGTTKSGRKRIVSIDEQTTQAPHNQRKMQAEDKLKVRPEWRGAIAYVFTTGW